jgi:hypothetical protein
MIPPARDESGLGEATPEMLAGIPVRVEADEDLTVRHSQGPQTPAESTANGAGRPTTDQLAGVYVEVEAPEDLTVHPPRGAANTSAPHEGRPAK